MISLKYLLIFFLFISEIIREIEAQSDFRVKQTDYNMTVPRIEVVNFNKAYIKHFAIKTFKHNRTTTAFNISVSFNCDITKLDVLAQAYKFLSNEYRLFPIHIQYNLCKALAQNFAGISESTTCGTGFNKFCSVKEEVYTMCNWFPDQSKFPPHLPNGQFMMEYQLLYGGSLDAGLIRAYGVISRREV